MAIIDRLYEEFLRVTNRSNVEEDRAKYCLEVAIGLLEEETGIKLRKAEVEEEFVVPVASYIYTPGYMPINEIIEIIDRNGFSVEPITIKRGLVTTRVLIGGVGIYKIRYMAGFISDEDTDLSKIPYVIREGIYHIGEWIYEKWQRGLIALEERNEFGGATALKDFDEYIKGIIRKIGINDV